MSSNEDQSSCEKSIITYDTQWPVYGLSWCTYDTSDNDQRLLLSSFRPDYKNYIQVELEFLIHEIDLGFSGTRGTHIKASGDIGDLSSYEGDVDTPKQWVPLRCLCLLCRLFTDI